MVLQQPTVATTVDRPKYLTLHSTCEMFVYCHLSHFSNCNKVTLSLAHHAFYLHKSYRQTEHTQVTVSVKYEFSCLFPYIMLFACCISSNMVRSVLKEITWYFELFLLSPCPLDKYTKLQTNTRHIQSHFTVP